MITAAKKSRSRSTPSPEIAERVATLLQSEISFINNECFQERTACRKILGRPLDLDYQPEMQVKNGSKLPSHLARLCDAPLLSNEEERLLFQRMNYLRYRANALRSKLSLNRPNEAKASEIEDLLQQAEQVKNRIVSSNVRLVVSIVKQLVSSQAIFDEMLSDGLVSMIRAVEKFDYDRGFRFSTYATMVIRRQLYRSLKNDHRDRNRFPTCDQALMTEQAENEAEHRIGYQGWVQLNDSLLKLLEELDDRERYIICARFGFKTDGKKQTLQSLAAEIGVCKERVRQLETRAMTKLRTLASEGGLARFLDSVF